MTIKVGDLVYYKGNGSSDKGVVTAVQAGDMYPYKVRFETGSVDWVDEDWFTVNQIALIT